VVGRLRPKQSFWLANLPPLASIVNTDSLLITTIQAERLRAAQLPGYNSLARLLIAPRADASVPVSSLVQQTGIVTCLNGNETLKSLVEEYSASHRTELLVAAFMAVVILVIGTLGFSGVYMAAMQRRGREFAIRLSLGASRTSLLAQVVLETVILSGLSTLMSSSLTFWLSASGGVPITLLDLTQVAGVSVLVGLVSASVPLFRILRTSPARLMHDGL